MPPQAACPIVTEFVTIQQPVPDYNARVQTVWPACGETHFRGRPDRDVSSSLHQQNDRHCWKFAIADHTGARSCESCWGRRNHGSRRATDVAIEDAQDGAGLAEPSPDGVGGFSRLTAWFDRGDVGDGGGAGGDGGYGGGD